jgi:hypothetical protein
MSASLVPVAITVVWRCGDGSLMAACVQFFALLDISLRRVEVLRASKLSQLSFLQSS